MITENTVEGKQENKKGRRVEKERRRIELVTTSSLQVVASQIYGRIEAAKALGVAPITIIRAHEGGHLKAYRVGRRVLHSGQHLLDWLEAGGRTGKRREAA